MSDAVTTSIASDSMKESDLSSKSNVDDENQKNSLKDKELAQSETAVDENGVSNVKESEKLNNGTEDQSNKKETVDSSKEKAFDNKSKESEADDSSSDKKQESVDAESVENLSTIDSSAIEAMDTEDSSQTTPVESEVEKSAEPIKKKRGRPPTEKRPVSTITLETRQKSKRPRRHIAETSTSFDYDTSPVASGASSKTKKSPFTPQSSSKQKKSDAAETDLHATPYYVKGTVLAVRNEDGGFYLCICPNNIFNTVKPFKVQWLDRCDDQSLFKRSYFDYLHVKSVLYAGVQLKKLDNTKFELPEAQEKKINHRLEKSLRGEEEISSDSEDEGSGKKSSLKRAAKQKEQKQPEKDASVEDEEDMPLAAITPKMIKTPKSRKSLKEPDHTRKLGKIQIGSLPATGVKRKSQKFDIGVSSPRIRLSPIKGGVSGATSRPRGRPRSTDTLGKIMSSSDSDVKYMLNPDLVEQQTKSHKSNANLVPNQAIDVVAKDPAFDIRQSPSHLPADKLAIRAAILQDVEVLESLFSDMSTLPQLLTKCRSVDVPLTALHYTLRNGNTGVLRSLCNELSRLSDFSVKPDKEPPTVLRDATDAQNGFKGDELSAVDISKGLKEGNRAFLKDIKVTFENSLSLASDLAHFACSIGLSPDLLRVLIDAYPKTKDVDIKELLFRNMYRAVEMGHVETALFLIRLSRQESTSSPIVGSTHSPTSGQPSGSSHGLTELHELVLHSEDPLPPAFTVKDAKKRSADSYRLLPVHFAACNSNDSCLKQLIGAAKECLTTIDGRNRRPIHYAAAATTSKTLEFLLHKVNIEEQDSNGMTPLMIAAESGREKNVDLLLKLASSSKVLHVVNVVERPDRSNRSAIHYAALNGHSGVIKVLAKYKADLNRPLSVSKARATPLMLASAQGHVQTCITLVEHGASVEIRDKLQRTALIHAAMNGHYPVITFLLNKGADPNVSDSSNNAAIHYAAAYGWHHCVTILLSASANPDVYNDRKMPPIGVALLKDHRETAQLLADHHADANFRDERGRTLVARLLAEEPLNWKLVDRISYLIETFKPDINAQDVQGMGPIHSLAANSVRDGKEVNSEMQSVSVYLAEMLLDKGAELNMADYRGRLPLYFAVEDMNVSLIELFVRRGTHCPRSTNSSADNVLHMLARNWDQGNMADIVFGLVNMTSQTVHELGSRRDKYGFTPMLLLAKSIAEHAVNESETETKKIVKKLEDIACPLLEAFVLAAKSDISAVVGKTRRNYRNLNDEGKSAAHYLSKSAIDKDCKVLACLLRHKPKLDVLDHQGASPLVTALLNRNCRAVQMLLDVGAQPNYCSNNPKQKYPAAPLILAVAQHGPGEQSLLPAIRALLRTISDIKLVPPDPRNGRTALMFAVEKEEEIDLVNALLEKQASLSEVDLQGRTALHLAVNASGPTSALFDIPDLLIEKKASLTAADKFGRIPLHYAYTKIEKEPADVDVGCDPIELTALLTSGMSGEQVDTADAAGRTPLHEAARRGAMICCMHLVERGANINRQDSDCNTPLSLAVKSGHNSCAVMLIQKGANVHTNVITIARPATSEDDEKSNTSKWKLRSSVIPPPKSTCEPVFKVVVERGWQGVTYVMLDRLEVCGVKYASAVESAMRARKYHVVLSLLRKQRDSSKLCEKNDLKQNLLHVLAINRPPSTDVQLKVARVLIERGVPSYTTDDRGCTPLHYAAFTKNLTLIKFFIDRNPSSFRGMIALTDFSGRNVFASLLWNTMINDDVTVAILKLFLEHDRGSGAINRVCKFPLSVLDNMNDSDPSLAVDEYFCGDVECIVINPLVRAIQLKAHRVIDLLLEFNVDINAQVEGLKNQTPLMVAVQQNDEYVVKKLLDHKTPVLLSALDSDNRTVLHHAAKPLSYGYWENLSILKLLIDQGVAVNIVDQFGGTALSYALEGGSGRMSDELQSVLGMDNNSWAKPASITAETLEPITWPSPVPEFEVDAVTILERIREDEMENESEQPTPNPDILSGLRESGEIVYDPTVNRYCDVFLTSVDVQQTGVVQYNFFRLQVIHQKGKNLYMFFTRWGLIGERGHWQTSPFATPSNAIKEFAKYFKLKTANEWRNIVSFKPQTRKFHVVASDIQRQRGVADLEFDLRTDIESLLEKDVQNVLGDLINVDSMKEAMKDSTNVDPDVMPFGRLEKDRLTNGISILNEIKELINSTTELKPTDPQDQIRLQRTLEKIQQRSTEYYRVLPPRGGIFDRIRPIGDLDTLSTLFLQAKRLSELEFANKVLLGAQYRINEINPLDYVYRSVGCKLHLMEPESDEAQYLLQCLHNTGSSSINIDCIYRVNRPGESSDIVATGLGNYRMLWRGTNILNLMSILHKGLQPSEAASSENLPNFGKGIYMSDTAARAMQDCKKWSSEKKYMLLCQVALGHVKEIRSGSSGSSDSEVANSIMTAGKLVPAPGKELILPEGGAISLGEMVKNPNMTGVTNTYNEYVVYSPDQVCLRYLIRFDANEDPSTIVDIPAKTK